MKQFSPLVKVIDVVSSTGKVTKEIKLIQLLSGSKERNKLVVLNTCLWCYITKLRKVDKPYDNEHDVMYQPAVIIKFLKHIFKCLKDSGVLYEQSDFRGMKGSYVAITNNLIQKTAKGE